MEPKYIQDTFRDGFQPYFDYEAQVELGILHSEQPYSDTFPKYHYTDCRCVECYKNHYPCNNTTECVYCTLVYSLMYDRSNNYHATGKQVKKEYGHIIDYLTFEQLGDVELDEYDIVWRRCGSCAKFIPGYIYFCQYDGYCSEECKEVDDEEMDDEEMDDEEMDDDNIHGYRCADIVSPEHYANIMNCWIDKRGKVRYVPYCNHDYTATRMGYRGTYDAECSGCIHVSEYWDSYTRWRFIPENPTSAQVDTMVALCLANKDNLAMPECVVEYMGVQRNKSTATYVGPMTTRAYYTLPLATRRALHQGD